MYLYPYKLSYHTKDYIWGGKKLVEEWNKKTDCKKIAESWELSVNATSNSVITNGAKKGCRLKDILEQYPQIIGKKATDKMTFPILVKLINAATPLSVQVHPDDNYALKNENKLGKCEMWYICDAEENGEIYLGLNCQTTKKEIEKSIQDNTIEKYLNLIKVKKGDCFFVPPGTLHAIRQGVTILEIQQNSDLTYRVYDYDRVGADGNKRELHIEKALEVIDLKKFPLPAQSKEYTYYSGCKKRELARCKYFVAEEFIIDNECELFNEKSFVAFTVVNGDGFIGEYAIQKGDTIFLPAGCKEKITGQITIVTANI